MQVSKTKEALGFASTKALGQRKAGCKHWNGKVGQLHIPSYRIALTMALIQERPLWRTPHPSFLEPCPSFYPGVPCKSRASPR